ncbi:MAG: ATP-binding protein [Dermatophilaceae bacterium]
MDSPYKPGFGARPAVLVGRDRQLAKASATLTRVANSRSPAPSALVLTGARGMGKTVTLGVVAEQGRDRGFVTAGVALDSVSDNVQLIAARVAESLKDFEHRGGRTTWERVRDRLAALSIEVNAGVVKVTSPPARDRAATQSATQREALAALLADGARLAAERDRTGLAIFVDELQEAPHADLVVIANAIQDALMTEDAPLAVFAAGLPQTPERVMAAASFTERFDFRTLERLDDDSAERALVEPALALNVLWDVAAARTVLASAAGSPYLIQRLGDETWTLANPEAGGTLTEARAREAIAEVQESLSNGMFRGRWAKATPAERDLMTAIAQVVDPEGVAQTRHITEVTGRTTPQLSPARQGLLDKGLVEAAGHGRLKFTMPGFAEFVRTLTDTPWYGPSGATPRTALPAASHRELPPADVRQL